MTRPAPYCSTALRERLLTGVPLFSKLAQEELPEVNTLFREEGFAVGELVCDFGTPARSLFVMTGGTVKLMRYIPGGRDWITVINLARLQTIAGITS